MWIRELDTVVTTSIIALVIRTSTTMYPSMLLLVQVVLWYHCPSGYSMGYMP